MSSRLLALMTLAIAALLGAAPPQTSVPPSADADVPLNDGATLHLRALPLGRMDAIVRDGARFDKSGSRCVLLATFPGGSIAGDWRSMTPTQAFVLDLSRRTLVALTSDGQASAASWRDDAHAVIVDGVFKRTVAVAPTAGTLGARARLVPVAPMPAGEIVSRPEMFRLQVFKSGDGTYSIGQVGAVRLRTIRVAPNGATALVGPFVAWIDARRSGGPSIARGGPDLVVPPSFSGTPYGDGLVPILPLGHFVYQGAYRNGVAFFAFSFGITRIVASTTDFVNYSFPAMPRNPAFTVGDGLGAGGDGILYYARPEDGVLQYWRGGKYVEHAMSFPDDARDSRRLFAAMARIAPREVLSPPMRPEADALDAALLEWRIYPVGDVTGERWIASFLGRAFVAGGDAKFSEISEPGYPFAALGRTDDGRVWGAAPLFRNIRSGVLISNEARLWSTRDGRHWNPAATVEGDPGAVGLHAGMAWVAFTRPEPDGPGVEVAPIGAASPLFGAPTGAIYAGEDLAFADMTGGLYLIGGGAPGSRTDDGSGPLVGLRLDPGRLFDVDRRGWNVYLRDRVEPNAGLASATASDPLWTLVAPSLAQLDGREAYPRTTIVTNLPVNSATAAPRLLSFSQERAYEIEYAWRPYPLSEIRVSRTLNGATVDRRSFRGPLAAEATTEEWARDQGGAWRFVKVISRWRI